MEVLLGHLCLGVLSCWDFGFLLGFCREVWLLFCVGENGKMWDFSRVLGFCFLLRFFLFCWLYGGWDFRVGEGEKGFFVLC